MNEAQKKRERERYQRRKKDPEKLRKIQESRRRWKEANPEKHKESQRNYVYKKRGYHPRAPSIRAALIKAQKGKCAVCGKRPHTPLQLDHCHSTGKIRGVLCRKCNLGAGSFPTQEEALLLFTYYQTPPADALEISNTLC